ncbi:MAG: hypothetical protein K6T73_00850 [Candidatus Bathyarchaeota archaeon]|nr:hypothetical protein [Candidatus Bathyarchaeota archaeon]
MKKVLGFIMTILVLGAIFWLPVGSNPTLGTFSLITTAQLEANLDNPYVRIVDVRPYDQYISGHIPNAVYLAREEIYMENNVGVHIPSENQIVITMSNLGIEENTCAVLYDDSYGLWATWAFFVLQYYGHTNVYILDGGWTKWLHENREYSNDVPKVAQANFPAMLNSTKVVSKDWILNHLNDPSVMFLDARSHSEYVNGHIPRAVNIEWINSIDLENGGVWKSTDELADMFAQVGITKEKQIVTYCQKGLRASHIYFTLNLLGYSQIALYDGSWEEWSSDPNVPIETGVPVEIKHLMRIALLNGWIPYFNVTDLDSEFFPTCPCLARDQHQNSSLIVNDDRSLTIVVNHTEIATLRLSMELLFHSTQVDRSIERDTTLLEMTYDMLRGEFPWSGKGVVQNFSQAFTIYFLIRKVRTANYTAGFVTTILEDAEGKYLTFSTLMNYAPLEGKETIFGDIIKIDFNVTLSRHYNILSNALLYLAFHEYSDYGEYAPTMLKAYFALAKELFLLSTFVYEYLYDFNTQKTVFGSSAVVLDACPPGVHDLCTAICGGLSAVGCALLCLPLIINPPAYIACLIVCVAGFAVFCVLLCDLICGEWSTIQEYGCAAGCAVVCLGCDIFVNPICGICSWACEQVCNSLVLPPPPSDGSGGGGCPFVYSWNGTQYVCDNNLLPTSESNLGVDVNDWYRLEAALTKKGNKWQMMICEFEHEHSFFDQFKILAVDHDSDVNIAVTPNDEILTYRDPIAPLSCIDNNGYDRLTEISHMDGNVDDPSTYFYGETGDYLVLNFGKVNSPNAKLILRSDMKCMECCIDVQVLSSEEVWQTVVIVAPRANWSFEAINLSPYVVEGKDLMVKLLWTSPHRLDYVRLDTTEQANIEIHEAKMIWAIHSVMGSVGWKLLQGDNIYAELIPAQHIKLAFILPDYLQGKRTFFLAVEGKYFTIEN